MIAATDTRLTLDTAATRRPAAMTGTASGSSTQQQLPGRKPIAVAELRVSAGTALQGVGDDPHQQGQRVDGERNRAH